MALGRTRAARLPGGGGGGREEAGGGRLGEAGSDESAGEAPVVASVDTRLCDWMRLEPRSGVPFKL